MDLEPQPLTWPGRALLLAVIAFGIFSVLYLADFWFFSTARRHPIYFALLSFAIFWGVYRSLINWYIYFFITPPASRLATRDYSVDVLITAMPGEPFAMFEETLTAVQAMTHAHHTFLLDGGNDPALRALCERLGVQHVNCVGVGGAKAGKINHCLELLAKSEVVFIVDPDHRSRVDLLERALPWFDDAKVGFVQVVQAYYNADESFIADAAAEQTFGFYGPTLLGLNGLGIPTAIGANCIFRRAALDSIGGHAVHLAEDALTSMRLHAQGWRSVYLPYRGTSGLVPADLGSFFKQQFKWSTGMFYLLFREYPKLFRRFDLTAKPHYFFAGTFYFNGLATFLTLVLPIWFLFFKVFAVEFPLDEFALHLFPYAASTVFTYALVQKWYTHSSERRVPWRSLVLEKGTWHVYLMGMISGLLNRRVEYLPTPKGPLNRARSPWLVAPHLVVMVLSAAAIVFALATYPRLDDGSLLMIGFAALNIVLLTPITGIALFPGWNWRGARGTT
ncbi:MAG TPA: glycosyltransferase family 2 protein [Polyangia bacterium]|nr:glycosyltransferase family 2 protein [Polyangia bacterium]